MNSLNYGSAATKVAELEKKILDGVSDYPASAKVAISSFSFILKSVFEILDGKSVDEVFANFELDILPRMFAEDEKLKNELVYLKSATGLSRTQMIEIKESLERRFSKRLFVLTEIDKSLIAGIVVQYKGQILDMSTKAKIESVL